MKGKNVGQKTEYSEFASDDLTHLQISTQAFSLQFQDAREFFQENMRHAPSKEDIDQYHSRLSHLASQFFNFPKEIQKQLQDDLQIQPTLLIPYLYAADHTAALSVFQSPLEGPQSQGILKIKDILKAGDFSLLDDFEEEELAQIYHQIIQKSVLPHIGDSHQFLSHSSIMVDHQNNRLSSVVPREGDNAFEVNPSGTRGNLLVIRDGENNPEGAISIKGSTKVLDASALDKHGLPGFAMADEILKEAAPTIALDIIAHKLGIKLPVQKIVSLAKPKTLKFKDQQGGDKPQECDLSQIYYHEGESGSLKSQVDKRVSEGKVSVSKGVDYELMYTQQLSMKFESLRKIASKLCLHCQKMKDTCVKTTILQKIGSPKMWLKHKGHKSDAIGDLDNMQKDLYRILNENFQRKISARNTPNVWNNTEKAQEFIQSFVQLVQGWLSFLQTELLSKKGVLTPESVLLVKDNLNVLLSDLKEFNGVFHQNLLSNEEKLLLDQGLHQISALVKQINGEVVSQKLGKKLDDPREDSIDPMSVMNEDVMQMTMFFEGPPMRRSEALALREFGSSSRAFAQQFFKEKFEASYYSSNQDVIQSYLPREFSQAVLDHPIIQSLNAIMGDVKSIHDLSVQQAQELCNKIVQLDFNAILNEMIEQSIPAFEDIEARRSYQKDIMAALLSKKGRSSKEYENAFKIKEKVNQCKVGIIHFHGLMKKVIELRIAKKNITPRTIKSILRELQTFAYDYALHDTAQQNPHLLEQYFDESVSNISVFTGMMHGLSLSSFHNSNVGGSCDPKDNTRFCVHDVHSLTAAFSPTDNNALVAFERFASPSNMPSGGESKMQFIENHARIRLVKNIDKRLGTHLGDKEQSGLFACIKDYHEMIMSLKSDTKVLLPYLTYRNNGESENKAVRAQYQRLNRLYRQMYFKSKLKLIKKYVETLIYTNQDQRFGGNFPKDALKVLYEYLKEEYILQHPKGFDAIDYKSTFESLDTIVDKHITQHQVFESPPHGKIE